MKKKILFVISTLNPGGAEIQLLRILQNLNYSIYDVNLFILSANQKLKDSLPKEVIVETIIVRKSVLWFLGDLLKLISRIKKLSPDIIHSSLLLSNLLVRPYKLLSKKTLILNHIHGQGNWVPKIIRFIDSKTAILVDKFIFVSQFSATLRIKREKYPLFKVNVLLNAIDIHSLEDVKYIKNDLLILGTLSRLTEVKKLERSIDIAKYLNEKGIKTRLLIAGEGEEKGKLEAHVNNLNLKDFVDFVGFQSNLNTFLSRIDILLSTSEREDLPINLIEGLVAGKPLIATNVGGVPEILTDSVCGLLINSPITNQDLQSIYKYVIGINFYEAESKNKKIGISNFSIKNYMDKLDNLYKLK
jgi:glycosyltransferase involved in cell wall biosynthesis